MSAMLGLSLTLPGFAEETKPVDGAKGLFWEQNNNPDKKLNTGVQYWIELQHRDNSRERVSNKHNFKSGDKIRFHVKANIDGYAYVLLKSGSRGEQSVLFPEESMNDSNKVKRGTDYVIPAEGFLAFDENPGVEKLSLIVSRMPIDAQSYLAKPVEAPVLVASAMSGAKDLIPQRVLVSVTEEKVAEVQKVATADTDRAKPAKVKTAAKPKPKAKTPPKVQIAKQEPKNDPIPPTKARSFDEGTLTTVVSQVPENILHVDVDLHHL